MTTYIDPRDPKVVLCDRLYSAYDKNINVVDGRMIIQDYLSFDSSWHICGMDVVDDNPGHDGRLIEFLKRATDNMWSIQVIAKENSACFFDGHIRDLEKLVFRDIKDISIDRGKVEINVRDWGKDTKTAIFRDSDVLGFILRPRHVVLNNKRVDIGFIKLTRHFEQYHSYFIDIEVIDVAMLRGIAQYAKDGLCATGYVELDRKIMVKESESYVVRKPIDFALAVALLSRGARLDRPDMYTVRYETHVTEEIAGKMLLVTLERSGRPDVKNLDWEIDKLENARSDFLRMEKKLDTKEDSDAE